MGVCGVCGEGQGRSFPVSFFFSAEKIRPREWDEMRLTEWQGVSETAGEAAGVGGLVLLSSFFSFAVLFLAVLVVG